MADLPQAANVNMKVGVTIKICDAIQLQLAVHEFFMRIDRFLLVGVHEVAGERLATHIQQEVSVFGRLYFFFIFFLEFLYFSGDNSDCGNKAFCILLMHTSVRIDLLASHYLIHARFRLEITSLPSLRRSHGRFVSLVVAWRFIRPCCDLWNTTREYHRRTFRFPMGQFIRCKYDASKRFEYFLPARRFFELNLAKRHHCH